MSNHSIESTFSAKPTSLIDLFEEKLDLGFRIPIYQRRFDWDRENIYRLFEDVLLGLSYRFKDENALTFLGTIILLEDKKSEEKFNGVSYSVVDGQQRLTTFSLLGCVLYEMLEQQESRIRELELKERVSSWLIEESENIRIQIYSLVCGELSGRARTRFPFPRIVREEKDYRAKGVHNYEYRSTIARILFQFIEHIEKKEKENIALDEFDYESLLDKEKDKVFINALSIIKRCLSSISETGDTIQSLELNFPNLKNLNKPGYRNLFELLPNDDSERDTLISKVNKKIEELEPFIRLILFASFLLNKVIFTRIIVTNPKYGFDIFDSLNTTGEPLTAIQTFKPKVVRYFQLKNTKFKGSETESYFNNIDAYLNIFEGNTNDKRQRAAKELIISFALYKTGEKLSLSLDSQRRYLHNRYEKISSIKGDEYKLKHLFVKDLNDVAIFRQKFWIIDNIGRQLNDFSETDRGKILLCLRFLKDTNSSLTIPILCRYYYQSLIGDKKDLFKKAVLALTAFVVLRRSVTLNTAGIDTDFRKLMSQGARNKTEISQKLSIGLSSDNPLPSIEDFKFYLIDWLSQKKVGVTDKNSWLSKVVTRPIYQVSTPLCRFIHLAAAHHSREDREDPWKLTKENVRESPETDYFSYSRWISEEVSTVEHIAPQSYDKEVGKWVEEIYFPDTNLKHTLGNLTLINPKENLILGNKSWTHKRFLLKAFSARTIEDIEEMLDADKPSDLNLSKLSKETLFLDGKHRPLVNTLQCVENWDAEHIKRRSKNIAELAWDEISPWLFT